MKNIKILYKGQETILKGLVNDCNIEKTVKESQNILGKQDVIAKEVRGKLDALGMEFGVEFEWDGGKDGHFFIENSTHLSEEDFNIVRNALEEVTETVKRAFENGIIEDIEELF